MTQPTITEIYTGLQSLNLENKAQALLKLNQLDDETLKSFLRMPDGRNTLERALYCPALFSLTQPRRSSPIRKLLNKLDLHNPQNGMLNVHNQSFSGIRQRAANFLKIDEDMPQISAEALTEEFECLMCDKDSDNPVVTNFVKWLIQKYQIAPSLHVIKTLRTVVKRIENKEINLDLALIHTQLSDAATAYSVKPGQPYDMFHPYSCHHGTEERILDAIATILATELKLAPKKIDEYHEDLARLTQKVFASSAFNDANLNKNTYQWLQDYLQQALTNGHIQTSKTKEETSRPLNFITILQCYHKTEEGFGLKDTLTEAQKQHTAQHELPKTFASRLEMQKWTKDKYYTAAIETIDIKDFELVIDKIMAILEDSVQTLDTNLVFLPFVSAEKSGRENFRGRLEEVVKNIIEEKLTTETPPQRKATDVEPKASEAKPSLLIPESTILTIQQYRQEIVKKSLTDGQAILEGFSFNHKDFDDEILAKYSRDLSTQAFHIFDRRSPNQVLVALALLASPKEHEGRKVADIASEFLEGRIQTLAKMLCRNNMIDPWFIDYGHITALQKLINYAYDNNLPRISENLEASDKIRLYAYSNNPDILEAAILMLDQCHQSEKGDLAELLFTKAIQLEKWEHAKTTFEFINLNRLDITTHISTHLVSASSETILDFLAWVDTSIKDPEALSTFYHGLLIIASAFNKKDITRDVLAKRTVSNDALRQSLTSALAYNNKEIMSMLIEHSPVEVMLKLLSSDSAVRFVTEAKIDTLTHFLQMIQDKGWLKNPAIQESFIALLGLVTLNNESNRLPILLAVLERNNLLDTMLEKLEATQDIPLERVISVLLEGSPEVVMLERLSSHYMLSIVMRKVDTLQHLLRITQYKGLLDHPMTQDFLVNLLSSVILERKSHHLQTLLVCFEKNNLLDTMLAKLADTETPEGSLSQVSLMGGVPDQQSQSKQIKSFLESVSQNKSRMLSAALGKNIEALDKLCGFTQETDTTENTAAIKK